MNLLITGAWNCTNKEIELIEKTGNNVVFMQQEKDPIPCDYSWVEGVVCNGLFLSHPIEQFVNLKYIQTTSAGLDRIPLNFCKEKNIKVNNARGVYSIPMAEFAISGVLDIYKKKRVFFEQQKQHQWIKHRELLELYGKKVLIFGCGSVGTECAKRFSAFECRVIGIDLKPYENPYFEKMFNIDFLCDQISDSDVVIINAPLTSETHNLFDEQLFEKMKNNSILVNMARGGIVNQEALTNALNTKLLGAVIDVFEEEPLGSESVLWDKENVIVTPHNSFVGEGNARRIFDIILKNMELL